MNKELHYASPELSRELHLQGIEWKASKYWKFLTKEETFVLKDKLEPFEKGYPAYDLTELGHLIPFGFFNEMKILKLATTYFKVQLSEDHWATFTSEVECRGMYLLDLIRCGKVKIEVIP